MPELPEVETLRRGLEAHLLDQRIVAVAIANPRILKGQSEAEFRDRTVGRRLLSAQRFGKHLFLPLSSSPSEKPLWRLHVHLNMRGSLRLAMSSAEESEGHRCLTLSLEGGQELRYHDTWGWGEVRAEAATASEMGLGPDALVGVWDADMLLKRFQGRRSPIKTALLDQRVLAGVGNIYADEALHGACVLPTRAASSLSETEAGALARCVRGVLEKAVAAGGSQGEFADLHGRAGRFVPKVYDRGGQPCPSCREPLEKIRLGGRGTTFCPRCQK